MKTHLLLRIGIHLIGIWSVFVALTDGVYQLHRILKFRTVMTLDSEFVSGAIAYFACPLLVAVVAFGFTSRIERVLLGASGRETIDAGRLDAPSLLRVALQVLGIYLIAANGAGLVSALAEMFAVAAGNDTFDESKVTSDVIYFGTATAIGFYLVYRARRMEREPTRAETATG